MGVFVLLLVEPFLGAFLPTLSGDIICDSLTVVDDEGKELVALGVTTGGDGGVWTTTKSGRKKRLD